MPSASRLPSVSPAAATASSRAFPWLPRLSAEVGEQARKVEKAMASVAVKAARWEFMGVVSLSWERAAVPYGRGLAVASGSAGRRSSLRNFDDASWRKRPSHRDGAAGDSRARSLGEVLTHSKCPVESDAI